MLNRTVAPPIKDAIDFTLSLKPYTHFTLDNGVKVYAIDTGAEEVFQAEWIFSAGNWYEKQNMVAGATNFLLKNGTAQKSAFAINEHFEYYGAYLNRSAHQEHAALSLHSLSKHSGELFPVVAELIRESVFPEDEVQLYKQNNKQRLSVNLKKSDFVATRLIDANLYGVNHPYGKYSTEEAYDALTAALLREFYAAYYQQSEFSIFIAGKLPKDIDRQLNKNFGGWTVTPHTQQVTHAITAGPVKKQELVNDAQGVQAAIRIAKPFVNRLHPDYIPATVLNSLLGGFFGSRLMSNIREDKGYTYGIHSYLQNHRHNSTWMISTEAGRDVARATVTETYKEMVRLQQERVSEEELLLVKNYMLGSMLGDLDGPFHLIARWKNIVLNQLPETFFSDSVNAIKSATASQLQQLAQRYLSPDDFYELVVI